MLIYTPCKFKTTDILHQVHLLPWVSDRNHKRSLLPMRTLGPHRFVSLTQAPSLGIWALSYKISSPLGRSFFSAPGSLHQLLC